MYNEVIIACPECDAQFIVPRKFCGGVVDCSECGTVFEIEALPEDAEVDMPTTNIKNPEKSTNTIVMSRSDLGMIPDLNDVRIN